MGQKTLKRYTAGLTLLCTLIIVAISFGGFMQSATVLMKWRQNDTIDTTLNVVNNKTGADEVFLEADLKATGTYTLTYPLENRRMTTVKITQAYESVTIRYKVEQDSGVGGVPNITNITQDLIDTSFLEMDYSLTVPDWRFLANKTVNADGELVYVINRSASSQYPGVAFQINNKRVILKWDFLTDTLYYQIGGYVPGNIMPVTYTYPTGESLSIKVLKGLQDFLVKPTYLVDDGLGNNIELTPIETPNSNNHKPGIRPGIDITFKQPKEFITNGNWVYDNENTDLSNVTAIFELDDIGSDAYLDFNFTLQQTMDYAIKGLPAGNSGGVNYAYDPLTKNYLIRIVKNKTDLNNPTTLLQWSALEGSSIYNVRVGFQKSVGPGLSEYFFTSYRPTDSFAYTYMEFDLKRANLKEAYLDIVPFDVGEQEEVEYIILYSKVIKPELDIDNDLWVKHYYTESNIDGNIFIPVPFRGESSQDAYQILVRFAGVTIRSQVLNYIAQNDDNIPPSTTRIESIDNLFVVPPLDALGNDPSKVQFDLTWTAPTNKEVKELDILLDPTKNSRLFYEVLVNDLPTDYASNPFRVVKVFEVYRDGGVYKLRNHPDMVSQTAEPSEMVNFDFGYNRIDELFRMDKIVLYKDNQWVNTVTTTINPIDKTYTVSEDTTPYDFEFPGVNYLRLRAIVVNDEEVSTSQKSIPATLSLSMTTLQVPIVDTLDYDPLIGVEADRTMGVTLNWQTVSTSNYENNMLFPIDKEIDRVIYGVYISENRENLTTIDESDPRFHEVIMDSESLININDAALSNLRDGQVVFFNLSTVKTLNTRLNVDVRGLDVNKSYNIRIVTKLDINDILTGVNSLRVSDPSTILGVTVPKVPGDPDDSEIKPLAPILFSADYADDTMIPAALTWQMDSTMTFDEDTYGFEIFSIVDRSLPTDLQVNGLDLLDIVNSPTLNNAWVEAWRIYVDNGETVFVKYDQTSGQWLPRNPNELTVLNRNFKMIDGDNAPNKVNYYYVRTIKHIDGEVRNTSAWVADSLTTAPVKGPINLIIDYRSGYTFDPKTELIIRFDAPFGNAGLIGSDYMIEVHVKGEEDAIYSYTKYRASLIGSNASGPAGYTRVYYRIRDLKPGKTYSVKIKIEDRTEEMDILPDGSMAYPKSPFSETVTTRTEFDQTAYDKESKYYEYINYYERRAQDLKEVAYFILESTTSQYIVKYRSDYVNGEIKRKINGQYELVVGKQAQTIYYLPSDMIETANQNNVTLIVKPTTNEIGIRPHSLGVNVTAEIKTMLGNIAQYDSLNKDYYVRLKISHGQFNGKIDNKVPTTPLINIEVEIVGSRKLEEEMDQILLSSLNNVIQVNKETLINQIEAELAKGIDDTKLLAVVEKVIDKVKIEFQMNAKTIVTGYTDKNFYQVKTLGKNMYAALGFETTGVSQEVYKRVGAVWSKISSNYFSNKYFVESKDLLAFILVQRTIAPSNLSTLYTGQQIEMVQQYELNEIFSSTELGNKTYNVKKFQYLSALARLLGAQKGYDDATYLINKGISVNQLNASSTMTYQEALGLYVDAFAIKHGINMNRVVIHNAFLVEDINQVELSRRQKILAAANLGIIPTQNGLIYPNKNLTMNDVITILTTLNKGISQ